MSLFSQRHKQAPPDQVTSLNLSLTTPHLNLDPTLVERLQPLLNSASSSTKAARGGGRGGLSTVASQPQLKHSLYMTTSNYHSINLVRFSHSLPSSPSLPRSLFLSPSPPSLTTPSPLLSAKTSCFQPGCEQQ